MRFRILVFVLVLAVIGGVGVAVYRGDGPFPDPTGCTADVGSVHVSLDPEQGRNAAIIASVGVRHGLPARAVSIAFATAFQESKLRNLNHGDRDSLGIFQQRPSQGWGTAAQVRDPYYASNSFYKALAKVDGFETMRITEAAQKVQRSAYPEAYEPHAADARALASALTGYSLGGRFSCVVRDQPTTGTRAKTVASLEKGFGPLVTKPGVRQDFTVIVGNGPDGLRRGWSVAQYLVALSPETHVQSVSFRGKTWTAGKESSKGWVRTGGVGKTVEVTLS